MEMEESKASLCHCLSREPARYLYITGNENCGPAIFFHSSVLNPNIEK